MKKGIVSSVLALALLAQGFGVASSPIEASKKAIDLQINGQPIYAEGNLENRPTMINNRVLVPLRVVSESLNAKVTWIKESKMILIEDTETAMTYRFKVGENWFSKNNEVVALDQAPVIASSGTTLVPIRVIGELYGKVSWSGQAQSVNLETQRDIKIKPLTPSKPVASKKVASQKADYENEYFSVVVPKEWKGKWTLEVNSYKTKEFYQTYMFSYGRGIGGGGAMVALVKPEYKAQWTKDKDGYGYKGDVGGYSVIVTQAGAGFFDRDGGAKLYLK